VIPLTRKKKVAGNSDLTAMFAGLTPTEQALFALLEGIGKFEAALEPTRHFRAVIFGSARVKPGTLIYEETRRLACELARHDINIVTGGGPGVMEAANRGALECANRKVLSFGICIEQINRNERPNEYLRRAYRHRHFCTRLHQFARLGAAGAFVVMPGGVGTMLELALILQLLQVEHLRDVPLIAVGDMWEKYKRWVVESMTSGGYAQFDEIERLTLVPTVDEALPIIFSAHERFKIRKAG